MALIHASPVTSTTRRVTYGELQDQVRTASLHPGWRVRGPGRHPSFFDRLSLLRSVLEPAPFCRRRRGWPAPSPPWGCGRATGCSYTCRSSRRPSSPCWPPSASAPSTPSCSEVWLTWTCQRNTHRAMLTAHSPLSFQGFAARELRTRIEHAEPRVIIAASCGVEPHKIVR